MRRHPIHLSTIAAVTLACATIITLTPSVASAHITLLSPPTRTTKQKQGPCGTTGLARGATVAVFRPGETITLRWKETIKHPGHCRVSFDADGDDGFVDPASFTDLYTNDAVLLDDIPDPATGSEFAVQVTLPDVECERCVLQVMQIMTDKAPYGDGNDLYYQCADIALRRDTPADMGATLDMASPADLGTSPDMSAADLPAPVDMGATPADMGTTPVEKGTSTPPIPDDSCAAAPPSSPADAPPWALAALGLAVCLRRRG